jgi:hypothetical protein
MCVVLRVYTHVTNATQLASSSGSKTLQDIARHCKTLIVWLTLQDRQTLQDIARHCKTLLPTKTLLIGSNDALAPMHHTHTLTHTHSLTHLIREFLRRFKIGSNDALAPMHHRLRKFLFCFLILQSQRPSVLRAPSCSVLRAPQLTVGSTLVHVGHQLQCSGHQVTVDLGHQATVTVGSTLWEFVPESPFWGPPQCRTCTGRTSQTSGPWDVHYM